ncbi:FAD dependent oxidoreductase-domain-containing protein [Dactylonectria macrodidyma]|uniref:FAD dependent oxidoreductase-domain-containing protein n=1 Tax=Dactylonectria macrodidyma TaxID=307937 RepID=A0A9P9FUX8_9HYPO|nr:FAD dependent oxidoreductase-domain-containing protein [Dactylonectria macrodidyma]
MPESFDLVVYGSTSGAVATAIQAARLGRSVALVSPQEHIGGIQINGLGATDIDNQVEFQNSTTIGGLSLELHQRISRFYNRTERLNEVVEKRLKDPEIWRFESRVAEKIISEWLAEHSLVTVIKSPLAESKGAVHRLDSRIEAILLENGKLISGKVFVEASYEGDLLAAAGITWTRGREASSVYSESLAGVRGETLYRQIDADIDPYIKPGDASSGLLYGISDEPFGQAGDGDLHLQSYSYRLPLTDNTDNRVPFSKPEGYDPAHYELHRRYFSAGGEFYMPRKRLPGDKTDLIGSEGALSTDLLGMNDEWPVASRQQRKAILQETARFTKGLLWFISTDPGVPEKYRREWSRFGYCKDEFPGNDNFPYELYVRDARRMISDYVITEATASREGGTRPAEDPIAVAYWPTDTHSVRRILREGKVHNEGFIFKDGHKWRPFGVAYRALVPKRDEAVNFITVTCPSSSHVGYGAVRLEHQFYAIGQACANASDIAIDKDCALQEVPYDALKERLDKQGVVLNDSKVGAPSFE